MTLPIEHDRLGQLLIAADDGLDMDAARLQLERAAIALSYDSDAAAQAWGQAALATIARCGTRMFRGGVYLYAATDTTVSLGHAPCRALSRMMIDLGCRTSGTPSRPIRIHVGAAPNTKADLHVMADCWRGIVSPEPLTRGTGGHAISGGLAGAMAVTEAFRRTVLGDHLACRRTQVLSAWDPVDAYVGGPLEFLPQQLWLLGMGNLGQAALSLLAMLPYNDTGRVKLVIQDSDRAGPENLSTQVLTEHDWIRRKKAACAADYARSFGFDVSICERRFGASTRPEEDEPRIALVGVDNLKARRAAAMAGFDLVLDAGLGSTAAEIFDVRLHAFPGLQAAETIWPPDLELVRDEAAGNAGLRKLVAEGRLDACGAMTIAGQSLGVPSTAVVAAALQLGQLCRALATGSYCDFINVELMALDRVSAHSTRIDRDLPGLRAQMLNA